jgi:hypothetical protein
MSGERPPEDSLHFPAPSAPETQEEARLQSLNDSVLQLQQELRSARGEIDELNDRLAVAAPPARRGGLLGWIAAAVIAVLGIGGIALVGFGSRDRTAEPAATPARTSAATASAPSPAVPSTALAPAPAATAPPPIPAATTASGPAAGTAAPPPAPAETAATPATPDSRPPSPAPAAPADQTASTEPPAAGPPPPAAPPPPRLGEHPR